MENKSSNKINTVMLVSSNFSRKKMVHNKLIEGTKEIKEKTLLEQFQMKAKNSLLKKQNIITNLISSTSMATKETNICEHKRENV